MSERNAIQLAYDRWGRSAAFSKASGSWYLVSDEVISVTNLQKSQYGPKYYINQAFWFRQLGDESRPKVNHCHIQLRLGSMVGRGSDHLDQLLDMEFPVEDSARIAELTAVFDEVLLPFIKRGASVRGLRKLLDEGAFRAAGIRGPAQDLLAAVA